MTYEKYALAHENTSRANRRKVIPKRTVRMSVKPVNLFSSLNEIVINALNDSTESSSRLKPTSPACTPMSPYKRSPNKLFVEITPANVLPDFMETPVKLNGVRINEDDSTIFDPDVTKGLADGYLLPKDRQAHA
ncbi:hypothetical protein MKX01_038016 [Papaver californicum]|nr:hypothetical protein MKX01_038016 [Papaver californicum]